MGRPSIATYSLPDAFVQRKARILASLSRSDAEYTDKSPKGSVDEPIQDLIHEINAVEGWVTTSSCSGRVTVFAEGTKEEVSGKGSLKAEEIQNSEQRIQDTSFGMLPGDGRTDRKEAVIQNEMNKREAPSGPGGKGHGGHWLYVSHEPLNIPLSDQTLENGGTPATVSELESTEVKKLNSSLMRLFGLWSQPLPSTSSSTISISFQPRTSRRLIRLAFSPLILHVLCASLHHARHLLSAAINSGFRESGVQSLKALDDPSAGVMVAIRTAGVSFETIIGVVDSSFSERAGMERMQAVVQEDYLQICVATINERFLWNHLRRERLREEIKKILETMHTRAVTEDRHERRQRKRMEGLKRQQDKGMHQEHDNEEDVLDDELPLVIG